MSRDSSEGCLTGDGADVAAAEAEIGELEGLNDRELADLGFGRRDIRAVARQASF